MLRKLRSRLTYANVMATIAVFLALGGAGAWATHEVILSSDIVDGEVRTQDIQNQGVRSADVRDDTLTAGGLQAVDLAPDSVGSSEVQDAGLTADDLADGAVGTAQLQDLGVTGAKLANGAVDSAKVADESLSSLDLASNSVGASEVSDESLGSTELAPSSVGNSEVADNAVGTAQLQDLGVSAAKLADRAVNGAKLEFFAVSSTRIAPNSVSSSKVATDSLTSSDIAAGAVGSSEVADGSLGTAEFASSIPAVRATRPTDQTTRNQTVELLRFTSEEYDTRGMHSNTSNTSRLTAPVTGIYAVAAGLQWGQSGFGDRGLTLRKNGGGGFDAFLVADDTRGDSDTIDRPSQNVSTMVRLVAGDFVEATVLQNSGGNLEVTGSQFSMTWLAPG